MDFNSTVDLIIKDLNEARDIIEDLKSYPGVPALQVELAKSKCKSASEVIALLKGLNDGRPGTEDGRRETEVDQRNDEPERSGARRSEFPLGGNRRSKRSGDPDLSVGTEDGRRKTEEETAAPVTPPPVDYGGQSGRRSPVAGIIADTFSNVPDSLNERLGTLRNDDDVTDLLKTKPLAKLSDAIGVNDKFLFIREIFSGSPESYEQAISRLDNAENYPDARNIIMNYTGNNIESEAARQLLDLVKRKFPADE